ncbi:MAG: 4-(cytidine 5'-diphospho)-2-C-methyl-D-erythritol kinase [Prevotellaceae bacterium]|nr:4-(cytidine 5'-diphospho)-2-C-methyl-D-erythritol kinase [Prevotellaceae bacterium]MDO4931914.1 4-(cytidine 5'-diphospho)-2-C-methyl-D-erythritol kinase [Prevotellaceae bacterium]
MLLFPFAKINLGLNVVERRQDGYHNIETVFYPIPITDALEVHTMSEAFPLNVSCSLKVTGVKELCDERKNLVVKAYDLLAKDFTLPRVYAHLHKDIPSQAGMGGGSSDAAFMLRILNEQFSLGLSPKKLQEYAACLGADCAFFTTASLNNPQPVYATGIGDILQPFNEPWHILDGKWIALVKPNVAVSTAEAYAGITPRNPSKCCKDIIMQPVPTWRDELTNDFEQSIFQKLPLLSQVKETLYDNGAIYAAMSGSGSTVFGIFDEEPQLPEISDTFTAKFKL